MKNNITEAVFILDASGSMYDLTEDTIGGFNSMLAQQKEKEGKVLITTYTFNFESKMIHDRADLSEVKDMTGKDYKAGGSTALMDAMGDAITHIRDVHKYVRPEDVPESTMFVIITDGMENASHKYSSTQVKKMVSECKEKGWEFIFLGANIDAVETAAAYGIAPERAVNMVSDKIGTEKAYRAMGNFMSGVRAKRVPASNEWAAEVTEDYESRK